MKKLAFIALLGLASTATAAPVGTTFAGWGIGLDLTSTKYEGLKRATGVGVVVDYGFDYGNNLVGLVEGKAKFNSSKLQDYQTQTNSSQINEKWRAGVSYLQGYRVAANFLPYVKVGYSVAKTDVKVRSIAPGSSYQRSVSSTGNGLGIGIGAKYAVSSNFELGAEYLRSRATFDNQSKNANTLGANATYRF
ncbi:MAG: porin family protein [Pasteurellaceae bacterium]|nr:porin family protein [Pasteurellaceae bacterium]